MVAYCVHPVLSGAAISNIEGSQLDQLVVTNTLPLPPEVQACGKIRAARLPSCWPKPFAASP